MLSAIPGPKDIAKVVLIGGLGLLALAFVCRVVGDWLYRTFPILQSEEAVAAPQVKVSGNISSDGELLMKTSDTGITITGTKGVWTFKKPENLPKYSQAF